MSEEQIENPAVEKEVSTEGSNTNEASQQEAPKQPTEAEEYNKRFQRLSQREQHVLRQKQELAAQKEAVEKYNKLQSLVKDDPSAVLQELGISYEDLVQRQIDSFQDEQKTPEQRKLEELESKLQSFETAAEKQAREAEEKAKNAAIQEFHGKMHSYYEQNRDKHPYLQGLSTEELNDSFIETGLAMYNESGKEPTEAEICEVLNSAYETQLSRFKHLFQPEGKDEPPERKEAGGQRVSPTLHSGNNGTSRQVSDGGGVELSAAERIARAVAAMKINK